MTDAAAAAAAEEEEEEEEEAAAAAATRFNSVLTHCGGGRPPSISSLNRRVENQVCRQAKTIIWLSMLLLDR